MNGCRNLTIKLFSFVAQAHQMSRNYSLSRLSHLYPPINQKISGNNQCLCWISHSRRVESDGVWFRCDFVNQLSLVLCGLNSAIKALSHVSLGTCFVNDNGLLEPCLGFMCLEPRDANRVSWYEDHEKDENGLR